MNLPSVQLKAIKFGRVLPENLPLVSFIDFAEIGGDFFSRLGPECCAVGKIRRPEDIVDSNVLAMSDTETIIDEGRIELSAKIVARFHRQFGAKRRAAKSDAGCAEALVDTKQEDG